MTKLTKSQAQIIRRVLESGGDVTLTQGRLYGPGRRWAVQKVATERLIKAGLLEGHPDQWYTGTYNASNVLNSNAHKQYVYATAAGCLALKHHDEERALKAEKEVTKSAAPTRQTPPHRLYFKAIPNHITHASGRRKTVCTSTCLKVLGIDPSRFRYCQNRNDMLRIMRRHGYSARSRFSSIPKGASVGKLRGWIRERSERGLWLVFVPGHVILLPPDGRTIVDTAPRLRDRRRVTSVYFVRKK